MQSLLRPASQVLRCADKSYQEELPLHLDCAEGTREAPLPQLAAAEQRAAAAAPDLTRQRPAGLASLRDPPPPRVSSCRCLFLLLPLLALAACCLPRGVPPAAAPGPGGGRGAVADELVELDDQDSHPWTTVRWAKHPDKCLDVGGNGSGARLQIWRCDENYPWNQRFIVPPDGTTGQIRWATHPELCLDSPGGNNLQLWTCSEAPESNLRWIISPGGNGRIRWAARPDRCVDIPDSVQDDGWGTQLWDCSNASRRGRAEDTAFITHPVDCAWGPWLPWNACSASCGGGSRQRSRRVARQAMNGGRPCSDQEPGQSERCSGPCGTVAGAPTAGREGGPSAVRTVSYKGLEPSFNYVALRASPKDVIPLPVGEDSKSGAGGHPGPWPWPWPAAAACWLLAVPLSLGSRL